MEENMKFFRTLALGALALGFALTLATSDTFAQRSRYGGSYYGNRGSYGTYYGNRGNYGSSYGRRSWGSYDRGWSGGYRYGGLTWRQRQRLRMIRYRMMQRNRYRSYQGNYYRRSGYYNYYPRNW